MFEYYSRYEPEVAEALTQMSVSGLGTRKVGEVAQTLMGVAPSASAVSRLNQTLTEQFETWLQRPLLTHYRVLYLDGVHITVRHGDKTDSTIILTALGVDLEGNNEVLALRACAEESKDGWMDLRAHGATQVDLIVTDGHDGLLAAVSALFTATPRQRCLVHKTVQCDERHSQTGAARGLNRTGGDLEAGEERRCAAQSGGLQSQIPPALSRSGAEPKRR